MYAIRSYYAPIDAISSEYLFSSEDGLNAGVNGLYNLMRGLNYAGGTGGLILGQAGFRIGTDLGLARVVITSYSIHYTKLYENVLLKLHYIV